jgi:hypothetical protein
MLVVVGKVPILVEIYGARGLVKYIRNNHQM